MSWLSAVLSGRRHPREALRRGAVHADAYGWHLPHYAYGSNHPDCQTCGTSYPCHVVRRRAIRGVAVGPCA